LQVALVHATSVDRVLVHRAGAEGKLVGTSYTSPNLKWAYSIGRAEG